MLISVNRNGFSVLVLVILFTLFGSAGDPECEPRSQEETGAGASPPGCSLPPGVRGCAAPPQLSSSGSLQSCTPRWKLCVSDTDSALGFAVGAMFVKDIFAEDSKAVVSARRSCARCGRTRARSAAVCLCAPQVEDMVTTIKRAFEENLQRVSWMDSETKKAAKEKVSSSWFSVAFGPMVGETAPLA